MLFNPHMTPEAEERARAASQVFTDRAGLDFDRAVAESLAGLEEHVSNSRIVVQVPESAVAPIVDLGRLRSQREEYRSQNDDLRNRGPYETGWYGPDAGNVIYGHFTHRRYENPCRLLRIMYGSVSLVLREGVRDRTYAATFPMDGYELAVAPGSKYAGNVAVWSIFDEGTRSADDRSSDPRLFTIPGKWTFDNVVRTGSTRGHGFENYADYLGHSQDLGFYTEAHILGGVKLADIEYALVPDSAIRPVEDTLNRVGVKTRTYLS